MRMAGLVYKAMILRRLSSTLAILATVTVTLSLVVFLTSRSTIHQDQSVAILKNELDSVKQESVHNCSSYSLPRLSAQQFSSPKIQPVTDTSTSHHSENQRPPNHVREHMAVTLDYWEQMGNALVSLYDFQCWASTVGITKVMEPFTKQTVGSAFLFLPNAPFTLSDLLDMKNWNKMSLRHSYAQLVSLQTFLDQAIKEIVYVQISYTQLPKPCQPKDAVLKTDWYKFLNGKGFQLVSTVCINFKMEEKNVMSEESFRDRIFDKTGNNVSLVFNLWTGVNEYDQFRVALKDSSCRGRLYGIAEVQIRSDKPSNVTYHHNKSYPSIVPSQRMSKYVERFKSEFLSGAQYVAVMMRTEKMEKRFVQPGFKNPCVTDIISDWESMKAHIMAPKFKTLFFSDAGAHGSTTWIWKETGAKHFSEYVEESLHVEHSLSEINGFLENITETTDAVLIAALQRVIASQAKCIIVVGEGRYQKQTLNMFGHYHRGEELCYSLRNPGCKSKYITVVYDGA